MNRNVALPTPSINALNYPHVSYRLRILTEVAAVVRPRSGIGSRDESQFRCMYTGGLLDSLSNKSGIPVLAFPDIDGSVSCALYRAQLMEDLTDAQTVLDAANLLTTHSIDFDELEQSIAIVSNSREHAGPVLQAVLQKMFMLQHKKVVLSSPDSEVGSHSKFLINLEQLNGRKTDAVSYSNGSRR